MQSLPSLPTAARIRASSYSVPALLGTGPARPLREARLPWPGGRRIGHRRTAKPRSAAMVMA
ncbi:hypothetical protein [Streptomyces sp. NPDC004232]|uniref:hypothetical protein n=1 Tax=unclassified Streptomyces TaxID=2593676 RepID=UPI0033A4A507